MSNLATIACIVVIVFLPLIFVCAFCVATNSAIAYEEAHPKYTTEQRP